MRKKGVQRGAAEKVKGPNLNDLKPIGMQPEKDGKRANTIEHWRKQDYMEVDL